ERAPSAGFGKPAIIDRAFATLHLPIRDDAKPADPLSGNVTALDLECGLLRLQRVHQHGWRVRQDRPDPTIVSIDSLDDLDRVSVLHGRTDIAFREQTEGRRHCLYDLKIQVRDSPPRQTTQ